MRTGYSKVPHKTHIVQYKFSEAIRKFIENLANPAILKAVRFLSESLF